MMFATQLSSAQPALKTWGVRLALALLLLGVAATALPPTPGLAYAQNIDQQVFDIARQLRCPVCRAESAADSNATSSIEFRNIIQEQLREGKSEAEIIGFFQARYGDWILLEPPKRGLHLLVWVLPIVVGAVGLGTLAYFVRRWTAQSRTVEDVDPEDLERVRRELARHDARRGEV
ncbi:MAG: cytochrome c-type biogenesis protein [Trueperaceae bacterium]|nr:cytochrome c-type biogenesis protein [Trueperaceae bacterium]